MDGIVKETSAVEQIVLSRISSKPEELTHGIVESEDLVRFLGRLYEAIYRTAEDKTLSIGDARNLFNVIPAVNPAFKGIAQVPAELADLDSDEATRLGNVFAAEIKDLPNTRSKELSIKALGIGLELVEFVAEVRELIAIHKQTQTIENGEG